MLRDTVGKDFTLKEVFSSNDLCVVLRILYYQVFYGWRKVCHEFLKRLDPDLPFYYHTSAHNHFYEGMMPSFDVKATTKSREKRIPRYELLGANERVSIAVRGNSSLRAKFHNAPVELPPPPGTTNVFLHEHAYYHLKN